MTEIIMTTDKTIERLNGKEWETWTDGEIHHQIGKLFPPIRKLIMDMDKERYSPDIRVKMMVTLIKEFETEIIRCRRIAKESIDRSIWL